MVDKPPSPLRHNVPIINSNGTPSDEFLRIWNAQRQSNATTESLQAQVEQLQAQVAALTGRNINTTAPLAGGGDLSADRTLSLLNSGVTPGSYTSANITVDAKGRITSAVNGGGGGGAFSGAMVTLASNITPSFAVIVPWSSEEYDEGGWWDAGDPTVFTVPSGVSYVRVDGGVRLTDVAQAGSVFINLQLNGSTLSPGNPTQNYRVSTTGFTNNVYHLASPAIPVSPGDEISMRVNKSGLISATQILSDSGTYFAIQAVG